VTNSETIGRAYESAVFAEDKKTAGFASAELYFKDGTLRSFTLTQGYFDALHLAMDDFSRAIISNYQVQASCRIVFNQVAVLICTGIGPDGERISVGGGEVRVTGGSGIWQRIAVQTSLVLPRKCKG
jgi:hypothetical protein